MKAEDLIDKNSLSDFTVDKDQGVVFVPIALTAVSYTHLTLPTT